MALAADQDGVATVDDCDDADSSSTTVVTDADCDGILAQQDCDDNDPTTVVDMDCDGILHEEDCDDNNPLIFPDSVEQCNGVDDN